MVAWHPKSSIENERTTIVIESKKQVLILLRQIAGAVAKRIVLYAKKGENAQGDDMGFIKFGSRANLFALRCKNKHQDERYCKGWANGNS